MRGFGYRLEGSTFTVQCAETVDVDFRVLYIPNGNAEWHYSGSTNKGTAATASGSSTVVLSTDPVLGEVGRNLNEYGGQSLRTFPAAGLFEERTVEASVFTAGNFQLNLRSAFDTVDGSVEYEIVPPGPSTMWDAIAWNACIHLSVARNVSQKKLQWVSDKYRGATKTCFEQAANADGVDGKVFDDDAGNRQDYILWG